MAAVVHNASPVEYRCQQDGTSNSETNWVEFFPFGMVITDYQQGAGVVIGKRWTSMNQNVLYSALTTPSVLRVRSQGAFGTPLPVGVLRAFLIQETDAQPFSSSNTPSRLESNTTLLGEVEWDVIPVNTEVEIPFDLGTMQGVTGHADWTGSVNITLRYFGIGAPIISQEDNQFESRLEWDESTPTFTGLSGFEGHPSRVDECPKCGGRTVRENFIKDGWTNLMVCPDCWERDEPPSRHLPPERRGVNDNG